MYNEYAEIINGIKSGAVVPFIGPGTLENVRHTVSGTVIPADSDSLIYAMNDGKPMTPRLMYEFSRAAMHIEMKKGRKFLENFLNDIYTDPNWTPSTFHHWLHTLAAPYIVDINRDTQLQHVMHDTRHTLIIGAARLAAHPYRFDIFQWNNGEYRKIEQDDVNKELPILFKPLGSPLPKPSFVASDADFVDYITELMGGFAIPTWLKSYRKKRKYVFMGLRFTRDTERMLMSDIIYDADKPAGWAFIKEPNDKEKRFLEKKNIHIIEADYSSLMTGKMLSAETI